MYADEKVRLVFREECGPDRLVAVWVRGEVTEDMLNGLVGFVERQRRRIAAKKEEPHPEYGSYWPDDPRHATAQEDKD